MTGRNGGSRQPPPGSWLGVDVGATKLAVTAVSGTRTWRSAADWPGGEGSGAGPVGVGGSPGAAARSAARGAARGALADLARLREVVSRARAAVGGRIDRVGLACAPTVGADGRIVAWPSRPAWLGVPLLAELRDAAGAPVVFADDGSLAALAEAEAAGCTHLVYLGLGTGLGGGVVSGGRLLTGAYGGAGELGHLPIEPTGVACRCGRTGCLQATVNAAALAAHASRLRGRATTTAELVAGFAAGQWWAVDVVDTAARTLARAVLVISEMLQPARVHLGGGLGSALADLPARVTAALRPLARPGQWLPIVAPARLGPDASLAGALLLARRGVPEFTAGPPVPAGGDPG